jgi:ribonuclease T1
MAVRSRIQKDGTVFGNRERLLPAHPRGYYLRVHREDAGFARPGGPAHCVRGENPCTWQKLVITPSDHYASFRRIVE